MKFQIGDVVVLKSGGPAMTVADLTEDGGVICIWFDGKEQRRAVFPAATLEK
jgi:uncharacterized protein YodC (DUF2158 family)